MVRTGDGWTSHALTREEIAPWIEAAHAARVSAYILDRLPPPQEGAFFANGDLENMAKWCASLIEAGLSHLLLWADYAVPLKFHPEAETAHQFRPAFTLARAAMECAAQAIWVLSPEEDAERGRRYFMLGIWDLDEQAKASASNERKTEIRAERDACLAALGLTMRSFPKPLYIDLVRAASEFVSAEESGGKPRADRMERVWRMAAGAAHGKQWPDFEIASRESAQPSISAMSEVLTVAHMLTSASVLLFAMRCGLEAEWSDLSQEGFVHVATTMTAVDGTPIRLDEVPSCR